MFIKFIPTYKLMWPAILVTVVGISTIAVFLYLSFIESKKQVENELIENELLWRQQLENLSTDLREADKKGVFRNL